MDNRKNPAAGERYRHFKDGLYQIVALAGHSETGEQMVVYQALYGDFGVYVSPLAVFMGEVDREKYPQARQKYRFERADETKERHTPERTEAASGRAAVEKASISDFSNLKAAAGRAVLKQEEPASVERKPKLEKEVSASSKAQAVLIEFLDADTYAEKLNIFREMKKYIDTKTVHDIAVCLDIGLNEKPLAEQILDIESCLKTYVRFECSRLR